MAANPVCALLCDDSVFIGRFVETIIGFPLGGFEGGTSSEIEQKLRKAVDDRQESLVPEAEIAAVVFFGAGALTGDVLPQ